MSRVTEQGEQRAPEACAGAAQPVLQPPLHAQQPRPLHQLAHALHRRQVCTDSNDRASRCFVMQVAALEEAIARGHCI